MTNTKNQIEIIENQMGTVVIVKGYPEDNIGNGDLVNQTKEENTIYNAAIVYEF